MQSSFQLSPREKPHMATQASKSTMKAPLQSVREYQKITEGSVVFFGSNITLLLDKIEYIIGGGNVPWRTIGLNNI